MSKTRTWIVEDTWGCSSCGKTDNRGRFMRCETCGSPKEDHENYVGSGPEAPVVTDSEMLKQAMAGKHWRCKHCLNDVRDLELKECHFCGAPRYEGKNVKQHFEKQERDLDRNNPKPQARKLTKTYKKSFELNKEESRVFKQPEFKLKSDHKKIAIIAAAAIAVVGFFTWLFMPHEVDTRVSAVHWDCQKNLEQRVTKHGEGWGTPYGSFNRSCERKWKGTEQCHPHDCNPHSVSYSCNAHSCNCTPSCSTSCSSNGNGYSTCTEHCTTSCSTCYDTCSRIEYDTCYDTCDVYDNWCEYDYYAWPVVKTLKTQGSDLNFECPDMETEEGRIQRIQTYTDFQTTFTDGKESWKLEPKSVGEFKKYKPNACWLIEVNHAGSIKPLQEIAR